MPLEVTGCIRMQPANQQHVQHCSVILGICSNFMGIFWTLDIFRNIKSPQLKNRWMIYYELQSSCVAGIYFSIAVFGEKKMLFGPFGIFDCSTLSDHWKNCKGANFGIQLL